jgi:hypothetical protein
MLKVAGSSERVKRGWRNPRSIPSFAVGFGGLPFSHSSTGLHPWLSAKAGNFLLTGGGCPGKVVVLLGSILSSLEGIFLMRKYEGGCIAGPIKGLRRRNFGKR